MIRGLVLALLATACGRISFDPRSDAGNGGNSDGSRDALDACAIRQLDIGQMHTCAVRADGAVFCAGDNANRQLGTGAVSAAMSTPVRATALGELGAPVASVHTGSMFTCALDTDGALHCLGDNGNRQLGGPDAMSPRPVPITAMTPALRAVSFGNNHGCGLTIGDAIWCWGDGDEGEPGIGTQPGSHVPEEVLTLSGSGILRVSAGSEHVCASNDSLAMRCWGSGTLFRLGFTAGDTCTMASAGTIPCQLVPTDVGASDVVEVAAGHEHTCVRTIAGGIDCWGSNDNGQAGAPVSTQVTRTTVGNVSSAIAVAAGRHHSCTIVSGGTVACWGSSNAWELGSAIPDQTSAVVVPLPRPAVALATNSMARFTCALLDDGTASCWGANDSGQLGRGTASTRELPAPFTIPCD